MDDSGLELIDLSAGQEVSEGKIELVEVNGQLVEQPVVTTSPDKAADAITIEGDSTLSDYPRPMRS